MSYTDPTYFLNGLLADMGLEQDTEAWAYDGPPQASAWWTANNPDTGQLIEVWIEHISQDACGTTALSLTERS